MRQPVRISLSPGVHYIIHQPLEMPSEYQTMFLQSRELIHANRAKFLHWQEILRGPLKEYA